MPRPRITKRSAPGESNLEIKLARTLHELDTQNRELREARYVLEASRDRYADLYDSCPITYATLDAGGVILDINLTGADVLGGDRRALIGRPLHGIARPARPESLYDHLRACLETGERVTDELTLYVRSRTRTVFQVISSRIVDPATGEWVCRSTFVDITARQRAEQVLRALGDLGTMLSATLEVSEVLGRIATVSLPLLGDACFAWAGTPPNRASAGAHVDETKLNDVAVVRTSLGSIPALASRVARAIESQREEVVSIEAIDNELIGQEGDAMSSWRALGIANIAIVPIAGHGHATGAFVFGAAAPEHRYDEEDLVVARQLATRAGLALEAARLYSEARSAARARDEIMAVVSHDLLNLAQNLAMNAHVVLASTPPEGQERRQTGRRQLEVVLRSVRSIQALVGDLLNAALLETGQIRLDTAAVVAEELIADALAATGAVLETKGVSLEKDLAEGMRVLADRERIHQVLLNLLSNAAKFSPPGGRVRIVSEPVGAEARFSVIDEGPGVPEQEREHIFSRYWQSARGRLRGMGLGLSIAKGLVEAHGGRIWVEDGPDGGSAFHFTLPTA